MAAVETDVEVLTDGLVQNLVIQVKVRDDSHPHIEGRFDCIEAQSRFTVMAISIHARAGCELDGVVTPSSVRELPLAQWEKFAKAAAQSWFRGPDPLAGSHGGGRRERAETLVQYLHPELNPISGKAAARKYESLVRYAEVLDEYAQVLAAGGDDPTVVIAKRRGVAPATVRSWLHRGREAGLDAAQRDMALGSRDPRWVGQLRLFKQLAEPHDEKHSEIMRSLLWVKASYLGARGSLMQRRRERDTCEAPPESSVWAQLDTGIQHWADEAVRHEATILGLASQLKEERARLRKLNITPPTIPRWMGPLVDEDSPASFWAGGYYAPHSFSWDLGIGDHR
jgi:hypothetical protein